MNRLCISACILAATLLLGGCATPGSAPEAIAAPLVSTTGGELRGVREGDFLLAVNGRPIPAGMSVDGIAADPQYLDISIPAGVKKTLKKKKTSGSEPSRPGWRRRSRCRFRQRSSSSAT